MTRARVSPELRQLLAARSNHRCAYCLTDERIIGGLFTIDHIIPQSLGGLSTFENLCLACWDCNLIKGPKIAGLDPQTDKMFPLFHPYKQNWANHFAWHATGLHIIGLTAIGRATVHVIKLNRLPLITARQWWIEAGWHPPEI